MTPQEQIKELKDQVDELTRVVISMQDTHTLPPNFSRTLNDFLDVTSSAKTVASETQAVDETGSSSYSVAKPMDGFKEIGGFLFPYYDA